MQRRQLLLAGAASTVGAAPATAQVERRLDVAGARIDLIAEPGFSTAQLRAIESWARRAATTVAGYLGRFPLPQVELHVQRLPGAGVLAGSTFAEPEPYLRLKLGEATQARHLADDWVLTHEMVHLAVPQLPRPQQWLHEGLATYIEGVAQVRAGQRPATRLWAELVRGLPQGQPQAGEGGLDGSTARGRVYWGGTLFCLRADIALLQASRLRHGLRQAVQAVLAAGGSYAVAWPIERVLQTADRALGSELLMRLYDDMKDSSAPFDLSSLWQQLGVQAKLGEPARLDDRAPLAAVRKAITAP
jgi:hypothetical protein